MNSCKVISSVSYLTDHGSCRPLLNSGSNTVDCASDELEVLWRKLPSAQQMAAGTSGTGWTPVPKSSIWKGTRDCREWPWWGLYWRALWPRGLWVVGRKEPQPSQGWRHSRCRYINMVHKEYGPISLLGPTQKHRFWDEKLHFKMRN